MNSILWIAFLIRLVHGLPSVAFPFNSQVPAVARVSQPYTFQFAEATFNSDGEDLTYSLLNAPSWLNLDTASRTLSGTPNPQDNGPNTFAIQAVAGSGSIGMSCTLVVTEGPSPRLARDVSSQLATSGILAGPSTLSLHPGDSFTIAFANDTFQGPPPILTYYATMVDHTPLASWIGFDSSSSSFFGVAPTLSVESQAFSVNLIASDVIGFSGAIAPFTLLVSQNQFAFSAQQDAVNVTAGIAVHLTNLLDQLSLNGAAASASQISSATIDGPSWLAIDPKSLTVTGTPPTGFTAQEVTISVVDTSGDMAVKSLLLRTADFNLFNTNIGQLTAVVGQPFSYALSPSLFSQAGLAVSVDIPSSTTWLSYDASSMEIRGTPPQSSINSNVAATLSASSPTLSASESQPFDIRIVASQSLTATVSTIIPHATTSLPSAPNSASTSTSASVSPAMMIGDGPNHRLSRGAIAGIVIGSLIALFLLVLLAIALCRCFRDEPRRTPNKREISGPMPYPPQVWSETDGERGTMNEKMTPMLPAPPPQVHLEFSHSPIRASRLPVGTPVASSIGDGEAMIRADHNIPVYGAMSGLPRDRHDSYSATTELTRFSTMGKSAQSKRSSWKSFRNRHSRADLGLGIDLEINTADPRPFLEKRQSYIRNRASSGVASSFFTTASRADEFVVTRMHSKSSPRPPSRNPARAVSNGTTVFAPSFPRAVAVHRPEESPVIPRPRSAASSSDTNTDSADNDNDADWATASEPSRPPSQASTHPQWIAEAHLPRHQRSWVAPGEASPTPPPSSVVRHGSRVMSNETARERMKRRLNRDSRGQLAERSSSPLSRVHVWGGEEVAVGSVRSGLSGSGLGRTRRSLREPLKLISNDSLSRNRERIGKGPLVMGRKSSGLGRSDDTDEEEQVGASTRNFSRTAFI